MEGKGVNRVEEVDRRKGGRWIGGGGMKFKNKLEGSSVGGKKWPKKKKLNERPKRIRN